MSHFSHISDFDFFEYFWVPKTESHIFDRFCCEPVSIPPGLQNYRTLNGIPPAVAEAQPKRTSRGVDPVEPPGDRRHTTGDDGPKDTGQGGLVAPRGPALPRCARVGTTRPTGDPHDGNIYA